MTSELEERRRPLSRAEALKFFRYWTEADREFALREIERVGALDFYAVESGTYVRCNGPVGEPLLWLHAGFIDYADGVVPQNALPSKAAGLVPLSRFSPGERGNVRPDRPQEVCVTCFEVKSAAGACSC